MNVQVCVTVSCVYMHVTACACVCARAPNESPQGQADRLPRSVHLSPGPSWLPTRLRKCGRQGHDGSVELLTAWAGGAGGVAWGEEHREPLQASPHPTAAALPDTSLLRFWEAGVCAPRLRAVSLSSQQPPHPLFL